MFSGRSPVSVHPVVPFLTDSSYGPAFIGLNLP